MTATTSTPTPDVPGPDETIRTLAAEVDAAWVKLGGRHGDLRQLAGWLREDPAVTAPPDDSESLLLQALDGVLKTLSLRRLLYLESKIRECAGTGRRIDL